MDKNLAKQKILLLRKELEYHNQLYYNEHKNEISDYEYDQKINNLIDLEKKFPEFNSLNSPSIRVGGKITKEFKTIKHSSPMLSLSNTYSEEELLDFDNYAEASLATKMAESSEQVISFLQQIADKASNQAQAQNNNMNY